MSVIAMTTVSTVPASTSVRSFSMVSGPSACVTVASLWSSPGAGTMGAQSGF